MSKFQSYTNRIETVLRSLLRLKFLEPEQLANSYWEFSTTEYPSLFCIVSALAKTNMRFDIHRYVEEHRSIFTGKRYINTFIPPKLQNEVLARVAFKRAVMNLQKTATYNSKTALLAEGFLFRSKYYVNFI